MHQSDSGGDLMCCNAALDRHSVLASLHTGNANLNTRVYRLQTVGSVGEAGSRVATRWGVFWLSSRRPSFSYPLAGWGEQVEVGLVCLPFFLLFEYSLY